MKILSINDFLKKLKNLFISKLTDHKLVESINFNPIKDLELLSCEIIYFLRLI